MTQKEIENMEINALALRNMADKQLAMVQQLRKQQAAATNPAKIKRDRTRQINRQASVMTKILTGTRK